MKKYTAVKSEAILAFSNEKIKMDKEAATNDEKQCKENDAPSTKVKVKVEEINDVDDNTNNKPATVIIIPQKYDILCGKDKACVTHEGSRHFRTVIDSYHERYQVCTSKQEKMDITKEIVEKLQASSGSRFLKFDSEKKLWQEISQMAARDKVSHALRFANQKQERKELRKQNKNKKKKSKRSSISSTYSSSSAVSVTSETGTKATTKTTPESHEIHDNEQIHKRRRISDPLPFANKEDEKLWEQFVKRQTKLLLSIQRGELIQTIEEEDSKSVSQHVPSLPVRQQVPSIEECQPITRIEPPPISVVETYPMDELDDGDDDLAVPIPVVQTSDDISGIMLEPLADLGDDEFEN